MTEVVSQQTGVLASLGIKGTLFAAQLVNFLIILFIVWRFVYRPLLRFMDERSAKIALGLRQAEEGKLSLQDAQIVKSKVLKEADQEAQALIEQARADAEQHRQSMLAQTREEVERQVEQARIQLKEEREATVKAIKGEMAELVMLATQKVLGESVKEGNQAAIIERAVAELDRSSS